MPDHTDDARALLAARHTEPTEPLAKEVQFHALALKGIATSAIKSRSRDVDDWADDMDRVIHHAGILAALAASAPPSRHLTDEQLLRALHSVTPAVSPDLTAERGGVLVPSQTLRELAAAILRESAAPLEQPDVKLSPVTVLPDGSGCFTASMPLPADHWLTQPGFNVPPMPLRMGTGPERNAMAEKVRAAARYAVRCATMNGKDDDMDPDALVLQMVVGLLGYWTADGSSSDTFDQPDPLPPLFSAAPLEPAAADEPATIAELTELVRWAYGKLNRLSFINQRSFSDMDDALKLDQMKLFVEHGRLG